MVGFDVIFKHSWLRLVVVTTVGTVLLAGGMLAVGEVSWPQRYELPDGLRGWVVIRYEIPSCSPMRNAGLFHVIVVDALGQGCTSDSKPRG